MNRRGFLRALAAIGVACSTPVAWARGGWGRSPALDAVFDLEVLRNLQANLAMLERQQGNEFMCFLHPTQAYDLRVLVAREEWRTRWREYRVARRTGGAERTPREIMEEVEFFPVIRNGEIGRFEGMNFAVAAEVA